MHRSFLLLCGSLSICGSAWAQCTISTLGLDPVTQKTRLGGIDLRPDGFTAVTHPYVQSVIAHSLMISDYDASGGTNWQRIITPTNPLFRLEPKGIIPTQDPGWLVYGDIGIGPFYTWGSNDGPAYTNQFAMKLNDTAGVEWARIYQTPSEDPYDGTMNMGNRSVQQHGLVEMPDGGYAWAILNPRYTYYVQLDEAGIPVRSNRYIALPAGNDSWPQTSLIGPDGSLYAAHIWWGSPIRTDVFKVDPNTNVVWSIRNGNDLALHEGLDLASNGDLVFTGDDLDGDSWIFGRTYLGRYSPSGQLLWENVSDDSHGQGSVAMLSDGRYLLFKNAILTLVEADGSTISSAWDTDTGPPLGNRSHIWSIPGQTAIGSSNGNYARVFLAPDPAQFSSSCDLGSVSETPFVPAEPVIESVSIQRDSIPIKSWPMAIGDTQQLPLDIVAAGASGVPALGRSFTVIGAAVNPSGTMSEPLTVTCTLPADLPIVTVLPSPTSNTGGVVTWTGIPALPPGGYWGFGIWLTVPADSALLGTNVSFSVEATQGGMETDLSNNTYTFSREVVGSWDPNNKLTRTSSGTNDTTYYLGLDQWIDYTINFQNTGTAPANDVVLLDTLPVELRLGSFLRLASSHNCLHELSAEGVLRFTFNNINLPDSNTNEAASHGAVQFRIKPEAGLPMGTLINNHANIYFDSNPAVRTNDSHVWIEQSTGLAQTALATLRAFPVPVQDQLTITAPADFSPRELTVNAMDGRCVLRQRVPASKGPITIDVADLPAQVYVLSLMAQDGRRLTTRFVKK